MLYNFSAAIATALIFTTLTSAHMMITKPVPYGQSTLTTSPLADTDPGASDSTYPCQQRPGVYDITSMNHITVGQPNELSFSGSASHGGGTCQLTVTKDKEPTANSTFKIFQVFEGGCPINSDGNSGSHPFTYVLPKDMPNGVMTFAWYWYNRIGNRELYMNCAPITVTGGADNDDYFDTLPNVYLVNMPTSECQTSDEGIQNSVTIPNPGQFVLSQASGQDLHAATGPGCAAAAAKQLEGVKGYKKNIITTNGASYQAPGGSPPAAGSATPSSPASEQPSGQASGQPSGQASQSSASSAVSSGSASVTAMPSAKPTGTGNIVAGGGNKTSIALTSASGSLSAQPTGVALGSASMPASGLPSIASAVPSGSSCSEASSSAMSCSSNGKKFGVCANGLMVWRDVAAGTQCKGGSILKRSEPLVVKRGRGGAAGRVRR